MRVTATSHLTARTVRRLDRTLVVWVVVWVAVGVFTGLDIARLKSLSDTLVTTGTSIRQTGDALRLLTAVPFVGGRIADLVDKITSSGTDIRTSGHESRTTVDRLSWVIGITLGLLPAILMALLYLPVRLAWRRDQAEVRAGLARGDPVFEGYLARRAIDSLPFSRLRAVSEDPWADVAAGEVGPLADAELARLGIVRPPARR